MNTALLDKPQLDTFEAGSEPDSMGSLLESLRQVRAFANEGYWLTGFEVCELLGLELTDLVDEQGKPHQQFQWRNFVVVFQGSQQGIRYWSLSNSHKMALQTLKSATQTPQETLSVLLQARTEAESSRYAASQVGNVEDKFIHLQNVLKPEQVQELLDYTLANESRFQRSAYRPDPNYPDYRRSMVLYTFSPHMEFMQRMIHAMTPEVCQKLGIPEFDIAQVEAQLTMHNHDNYYKIHNDNSSDETATRRLTFVYYYYREPRGFEEGKLRIYNRSQSQVNLPGEEQHLDIEPYNNSLILFPSHYMHEVMRVECESRAFADSRFTINGWVREKVVV